MNDQTPEQIAREFILYVGRSGYPTTLKMKALAEAYLASTATLLGPCPAMCASGIDVDCGVPPDECCDVCGGAGSVLTEDGKRMEEIRSRLYLRMPNTEESEWLLSRLTAALNEIERLKKEALNGKSPLAG